MDSTCTHLCFVACAALVLTGSGPARAAPGAGGRLLDQLTRCQAVPDPTLRLGCLESGAAALKAAVAGGDVVLVDRERVREVRRQAFGFSLPAIGVFDGDGKSPERLDRIESRLAGATRDPGGRWTFRLEDGGAWTQVDGEALMLSPAKGMTAIVRKGPVGAYFLGLDGHAGVRVRRIQ